MNFQGRLTTHDGPPKPARSEWFGPIACACEVIFLGLNLFVTYVHRLIPCISFCYLKLGNETFLKSSMQHCEQSLPKSLGRRLMKVLLPEWVIKSMHRSRKELNTIIDID
jgi:hypothetical protein